MIDEDTDIAEYAKSLAPGALQGKTNWEGLIDMFAAQNQLVETTLIDLIDDRTVDNAADDTLDVLGRLVGQERGGLSDSVYRGYIRARIAVNKSNGTWEELISIARLVTGDAVGLSYIMTQYDFMTVRMDLQGAAVSDDTATAIYTYLQEAIPAGERVVLWYNPTAGNDFTLGDGSITTSTTLGYDDAAAPATGGELISALG